MNTKNNPDNRYKLASLKVLDQYPMWKRSAVLDDIKNRVDNSYTHQYAKDVVSLAENEEISLTE